MFIASLPLSLSYTFLVDILHQYHIFELFLVVKELMGQRTWIRLYPYIRTAASIAYYSFTTLAGVQTLGEEYVKLFQVHSIYRAVPSFRARLLFVFIHVVAPIISQISLQKAQRLLAHPSTSSFLGIPIRNNPKARRSCKLFLEWMSSVGMPQLHRIHLALFYIFGVYYNVSRRIAGIRYLSLSPQTDAKALKVYKFLGYLTLMQTALSVAMWIFSIIEAERHEKIKRSIDPTDVKKDGRCVEDVDLPHPWFRCPVCLEGKSPSTTSCGHLFCWKCIQEHAFSADDEVRCPQCRTLFEPSQVVPLLNL